MRRVRLHLTDGIALDVATLRGVMVSRRASSPPTFDDAQSYVLRVEAANIALDMPSLTNLMSQQVFAHGAPLRDLSVSVGGDGRLVLKGKLHKGVAVPFSSKATVSATADGRLRLHVDSVKALGLPVKGLMDLLGLEVKEVMKIETRRDLSVKDDDLFVSPNAALPPPEIRGRLTNASTAGQRLVLTLGHGGERVNSEPRAAGARNYIYFGSGTMRFGKLTMHDADLQLIDDDPRDPFDFFPARYQGQLVAGYSKNTPAGGLRTFMPDYDDLARHRAIDLRPRGVHVRRRADPASPARYRTGP